jgi:hypothetical protein
LPPYLWDYFAATAVTPDKAFIRHCYRRVLRKDFISRSTSASFDK